MQLKLIIHCVLLFCLEFSAGASVPHDINPHKLPGINHIKPPNAAYRQANIPRSHQVWNQRPPYPLPTHNQEFPHINHNFNILNDPERFVPNVPQHITQAQFPNGYPNQHRIPSNIARKFPNVPNQVDKNNIKNIPVAQNVPIKNEVFKSFVPLIPSRPLHTGTSKTKLNKHHVKIIPSIESSWSYPGAGVAPVPSGDRYLASASSPVETITRKLTPPRYDVKQFVTNSNIRNILATTKHKKRYLVILPNGTIEHVDKLETVVQRNPNYVLIQAGDIISKPIRKVEKVQEVATKPVHSKKLQNVSVNTPVSNTVKEPIANQSTLPPAKNHITLLKPVSVPPKQIFATAEVAKSLIAAKNSTTIPSTPKAPTNHLSRNETVPTVAPSKTETIFSNGSKNDNNPEEKINQKNPEEQILDTTLDSSASESVHKETKLLAGEEKPTVTDEYDKQRPNNKSITICKANVTNDKETETPPATLAKPVKQIPVQETPLNEIVVKASVQTPKDNTSPVLEAVAVAETVTETKPVIKDSTPVSHKEKILPIEKSNKIDVIPKPTEGKSALSAAASNATAEVKIPPSLETAVVAAKTTTNSTETSTPVSKQHNITPSVPKKTLEKDKKPNTTVVDTNDNPHQNTTNLRSNTEDEKENYTPAIWFKTSDPDFWEQLRGENKEDVVLFFQIHNRPKVEYNTTRTIYPNGTIVEETTKSLWEIEGDPPIVTKTTQIINPADPKR